MLGRARIVRESVTGATEILLARNRLWRPRPFVWTSGQVGGINA
jgi:hypothetical protein